MSDFITALTGTGGISASSLWTSVSAVAPFIVIIFGFAFGYRILRKVLKSGSKGKVNI